MSRISIIPLIKKNLLTIVLLFISAILILAMFKISPVFAQGTIELISKSSSGVVGNDNSLSSVISADGRYVAFTSAADDLAPGNPNNGLNGAVFLRDRVSNTTELISWEWRIQDDIEYEDETGALVAAPISISEDGKYIAYTAPNRNVYVRDWANRTTKIASLLPDGNLVAEGGSYPALSADGSLVVFASTKNLDPAHPQPNPNGSYIYLRDLQNDTTTMVSLNNDGSEDETRNLTDDVAPGISGDGRYVVWNSLTEEIRVRDRQTNTTETIGNGRFSAISGDGNYVAFVSNEDLLPEDANGVKDIYLYDRTTQHYELISPRLDNSTSNSDFRLGNISENGRYITFDAHASNLVSNDVNDTTDVFVRDRLLQKTELISTDNNCAQLDDQYPSRRPSISGNGQFVSFEAYGAFLAEDTNDPVHDIYLVDRDNTFDCPTEQDPVTISFNPSADSYVRNGQANQNEGGGQFIQIQASGNNRGLLRFDQYQLQKQIGNHQVLSAKLRMTITDNGNNWSQNGRTVDVHRLISDWVEGNGTENDRGTGSGATWNCAIDSDIHNTLKNCSGATEWEMGQPNNPSVHPWIETASATQTINNNQSGIVEFDVTTDVTEFLQGPSSNYGWIMKKTDEGQPGQVSFGSRESGSIPQLVITYQP